ncbi:MAG: FliH/SctL family protein [Oscillospiraceae bacterium]|nr:FliH/SctL family protein [Oscillospiraceae bacterium]
MFRIDRNLVNLSFARSVQVEVADTTVSAPAAEAPVNTVANAMTVAQETINKAKIAAEKMIEDARDEVAAMLLAAREQAEEDRRCAWQEGYTEGAEEGRRVTNEEYNTKCCKDDEMLKRVLDELYAERELTYGRLEDEVISLTLDIVKKIIKPAEDILGDVYESLIRNALKQIAPEGKIIIRVSPTEYERYFSSGSAVFELDRGVTVTASILRDTSLEEGDCIIDTEEETVSAGIDTQLKYIKIAFNRADD